jgi:hypothetical protein
LGLSLAEFELIAATNANCYFDSEIISSIIAAAAVAIDAGICSKVAFGLVPLHPQRNCHQLGLASIAIAAAATNFATDKFITMDGLP